MIPSEVIKPPSNSFSVVCWTREDNVISKRGQTVCVRLTLAVAWEPVRERQQSHDSLGFVTFRHRKMSSLTHYQVLKLQ